MILLLIVLTVVEALVVVGVLAAYLVLLHRRLVVISTHLGRIAFGIRAVETQTASIGPSVLRINATLREINGALPAIAAKAERLAGTGV
ncbi:hypothetical protein [Pseudonocardia nigra]|uniref:hypothetical protein n=1 Tax=Pseudonocardia nigra TaxID=1921578 RepID=UPI001C5DDB47|nr:hypothetical protein [Pseudonocardia nigra]